MVTASHNPPARQRLQGLPPRPAARSFPPSTREIAAQDRAAPRADAIPRPAPPDAAAQAAAAGRRRRRRRRGRRTSTAWPGRAPPRRERTRCASSTRAMHGVGHRLMVRAFARAGFEGVAAVPLADRSRRRVPHGRVPEPGGEGCDGPRARARDRDARPSWCSRTIRTPTGWRSRCRPRAAAAIACCRATRSACCWPTTRSSTPTPAAGKKLVVTTVVSSSLLSRMAHGPRRAVRETLTGFKWIADAALRAERDGDAFVFGYEEALGYPCGPLVRDKDGIGAALRHGRAGAAPRSAQEDAARPARRDPACRARAERTRSSGR